MRQGRSPLPVWLMGFGFLPLGVTGAIMLITVPQLLEANHVPEQQIASVTAIGLIPGFASFLLSPLLDWRFPRRTYAIAFALIGALCTFGALIFIQDLVLLSILLFTASMAVALCVSAVGGWFGNLTRTEDKGTLGAWFTVANVGGGGLVAASAISILRELPYALGAGLLSLLALTALPLFLWVSCPPADRHLASEGFRDFARDVLALLRDRSVLLTLLLFCLPAASFALTNSLGGLGNDFNIAENMVGLIGGIGAAIVGVISSLFVPHLIKRIDPRTLYLIVGGGGALFTLMLILLPHNPACFVLAFLGETAFQAAAFSVENAIVLRTIGHNNPLAATQFGLLNAATSLPLAYMQIIDGQAYGIGGVNGSYLADGLVSGGACVALAIFLRLVRRKSLKRASFSDVAVSD